MSRRPSSKRALLLPGGGLKAAYCAQVARRLIEDTGQYDHIFCASGGAMSSLYLATGQGARVVDMWAALDCPKPVLTGIPGMLRRGKLSSIQDGGLVSLAPWRQQVRRDCSLLDLQCPIHVAVCVYGDLPAMRVITLDTKSRARWAGRVISASGSMPGIFEPVSLKLDGEKRQCVDGAMEDLICPVPDPGQGFTVVDIIPNLTLHLTPDPVVGDEGVIGMLLWALELGNLGRWRNTLAKLQALADDGCLVRIWEPPQSLGPVLNGSAEWMQHRISMADQRIKDGPTVLRRGR